MRIGTAPLALLLAAALPLPAVAAPQDSLEPLRLDPAENFAKSLILPAWGSYESESYLAASLQTLADALAVAALVGLAVAPPNPDAGVHLAYLLPAGMLVGNRLLGAPLNAALASAWRGSPGERRDVRLPAPGLHGRLSTAAGAYAGSGEVTLGAEWRRAGLKVSAGLVMGGGPGYDWTGPDGVSRGEHADLEGLFGVDAYYRIGLNAFMDLEPGLRCNFERYRYYSSTFDSRTFLSSRVPGRRTAYAPSFIPRASLVLHPYRRLELALGAGYALGKPSHLEELEERAAARAALRGRTTPWRLNAELAVPVF